MECVYKKSRSPRSHGHSQTNTQEWLFGCLDEHDVGLSLFVLSLCVMTNPLCLMVCYVSVSLCACLRFPVHAPSPPPFPSSVWMSVVFYCYSVCSFFFFVCCLESFFCLLTLFFTRDHGPVPRDNSTRVTMDQGQQCNKGKQTTTQGVPPLSHCNITLFLWLTTTTIGQTRQAKERHQSFVSMYLTNFGSPEETKKRKR